LAIKLLIELNNHHHHRRRDCTPDDTHQPERHIT